jgi:hypothetical protein
MARFNGCNHDSLSDQLKATDLSDSFPSSPQYRRETEKALYQLHSVYRVYENVPDPSFHVKSPILIPPPNLSSKQTREKGISRDEVPTIPSRRIQKKVQGWEGVDQVMEMERMILVEMVRKVVWRIQVVKLESGRMGVWELHRYLLDHQNHQECKNGIVDVVFNRI